MREENKTWMHQRKTEAKIEERLKMKARKERKRSRGARNKLSVVFVFKS